MKVALIIEHFDAQRGGAEAFTVWLARQLVALGHEVDVVCHDVAARVTRYRQATQRASHDADRSHAALARDENLPQGVRIHRLKGMKLRSGIGFRRFGIRAQRWCDQHQPDVAHSMTVAWPGDIYHPHAGVYAEIQAQAIASRSTGAAANFKRLLLRISGKQRTLLTLEERALTAGPRQPPFRIISISSMMTRQLVAHYSLDRRLILELPNPRLVWPEDPTPSPTPAPPSDDQSHAADERSWFRAHYGLSATDRVAVFIGHDFRRKGLRYAIETIAQTHWKLLVVGLGKTREYIELAQDLGLTAGEGGEGDSHIESRDHARVPGGERGQGQIESRAQSRVLFIGPTREVDSIYAASDALLLPTFYDSFGLVVPEALSQGLPVISTELLGASYLVQQHQVGTIVPTPRHVVEMAQALEALPARDSPEGIALAKRARTASIGIPPAEYMQTLVGLYKTVSSMKKRQA